MKKRGFGAGKWNGYGGKLEESETPRAAAARELKEESSLITDGKDLEQVALVTFYFDDKPAFECYVFTTHHWEGQPIETEEMRPQWYPTSELPFAEMWAGDTKWVPLILEGKKIKAKVKFNTDGSMVKEFSYKEAKFNIL
jgi:ADP-ribose pyrophosphatase YjhB (NUDIX family)